jgi:hypothetical protein
MIPTRHSPRRTTTYSNARFLGDALSSSIQSDATVDKARVAAEAHQGSTCSRRAAPGLATHRYWSGHSSPPPYSSPLDSLTLAASQGMMTSLPRT